MNILEKIICFIGGANLKILQKCPSDKIKFVAVGIGVLNTALLSMCTMGFAMYSIAKQSDILLIVLFSIFWGFIIFGIDWGLITTIHKKKNYDLKSSSVLVLTTMFRLLVAIVISFTVSKPLEVLVFKDYLPTARNEMQEDYQKRLNSSYIERENTANANLTNVEDEIIKISDEKQKAYKEDPFVKQLTTEKNILQAQYNNLSNQYKELNSESSKKSSAAQKTINTIQSNINQIKNSASELSSYQKQQISNLENSKQPHISNINFENGEIRRRNTALSTLNSKTIAKQGEINDRYSVINTDFDDKRTVLNTQHTRLKADKDSISKETTAKKTNNANVSEVFMEDNLINNIIAIGYLEKWRNDPNAEFGEKEIADKVFFVSWLLVILIMIIDTAPIVIKLLVKRGCYEVEKEKIEIENEIRCQADTVAYNATYPAYALMKKQYETKINEQTDLSITTNEFFKIINSMVEKTMGEIKKIIVNSNGKFPDIQDELENSLDTTRKKMLELYNNFINSINN